VQAIAQPVQKKAPARRPDSRRRPTFAVYSGAGVADLRRSFAAGSAFPLLTAVAVPASLVLPIVAGASLVLLAALGALAARVGRAPVLRASIRVAVLGALAMGVTAGIGRLFGAVI
jgi:VIT family